MGDPLCFNHTHQCLQSDAPHALSELPPALLLFGDPNRFEGHKERKVYRYETMMTPYEQLKALPKAEDHLKPGITF